LNVLDTSVPVGSGTTKVNSSVAAYAGQFNTLELQEGWVGMASNTIAENKDLKLDPSFIQPFALIASNAKLIPDSMAKAIINPEDGGTSTELVDTMVRVAATDGPAVAQEMMNSMSAGGNGSSVTALNNIQTRQSTQLLPPQTIISSPPPMGVTPSPTALFVPAPTPARASAPAPTPSRSSDPARAPSPTQIPPSAELPTRALISDEDVGVPADDLQAVAYGMAAGDSPYDKYGVWMSLNAGKATQKAMKGNAGFKSHSEGFALGVDTMINERTSIGITVSNTISRI
jgi:outer membrane autotransporter protein